MTKDKLPLPVLKEMERYIDDEDLPGYLQETLSGGLQATNSFNFILKRIDDQASVIDNSKILQLVEAWMNQYDPSEKSIEPERLSTKKELEIMNENAVDALEKSGFDLNQDEFTVLQPFDNYHAISIDLVNENGERKQNIKILNTVIVLPKRNGTLDIFGEE